MPTYDYQCEKCGQEFEQFQSMKDDALDSCPKDVCPKKRWGKGKVRRAIGSGAGLIFKGSGFYITDYRSENYKAGAKSDKAGAKSDKGSAKGEKTSAANTGKSKSDKKSKKSNSKNS
jgi:putative FmdB family regulatory protein